MDFNRKKLRLGDVLVNSKAISNTQLLQALDLQKGSGKTQHVHTVLSVLYGEDLVLLQHIHRDQIQDILTDRDSGQIDQLNVQLGAQRHRDLFFRYDALVNQHFTQLFAAAFLQIQRLQQLGIGDRLTQAFFEYLSHSRGRRARGQL